MARHSIEIRKVSTRDAEPIARIHAAAIRALDTTHYTQEELDSWAAGIEPSIYLERIQSHEFLVAEDQGEPVGFAVLDPQTGEIPAIYVDPARIRQGIGRRLLWELQRRAKEQYHLQELTLRSSLNAVAFYEAGGFQFVEFGIYRTRGGREIRCALMRMSLA